MHPITLPISEETLRELHLGENVTLTGRIFTARDSAHKYLVSPPDGECCPPIEEGVLYHCGPVIIRNGDEWQVTAAGPTTSMREEPYMSEIIRKYHIRAIIGKGGMGAATAEACRQYGCVYLHAVGGAAQILANAIQKVEAVYKLQEFGAPEAIWQLKVCQFPAIVTMDCFGNSLHQQVAAVSRQKLEELLQRD